MPRTRFWVNVHSLVASMSINSLLETDNVWSLNCGHFVSVVGDDDSFMVVCDDFCGWFDFVSSHFIDFTCAQFLKKGVFDYFENELRERD